MSQIFCLFLVGFLCSSHANAQQQRVPPGVSPQHYQQPAHQAHQPQQQVPQHQFQQVPGQVPMQQVPVQQVPVQHAPTHQAPPPTPQQGHGHEHPQQLLNPANIVHEQAHIAEHMEAQIDTSKMTEQEQQFYYFKIHDADNNNKLDGCELVKSLVHWHEQGNQVAGGPNAEQKIFKDEELVALVDPIISLDDVNNDGYIDYPEFLQAQQKAGATGRQ